MAALALQFMQAWTGARSAALLVREAHREASLVLSDAIDQGVLDDVQRLWQAPPPGLTAGALFRGQLAHAFFAVPWLVGGELRGITYLELEPGTASQHARHLRSLGGVLAMALMREYEVEAPAAWTSDDVDGRVAVAAANLFFLLERHEWNVSRVARALDVTRGTVYHRMRRAGIPRLRVHKTRARRCQPERVVGKDDAE